jgi:hypothetical protein
MTGDEYTCMSCGKTTEHSIIANHEPFPVGWHNRHIDEYGNLNRGSGGKPYLLCESCGGEGAFIGGMSPSLRESFRKRGIEFKEQD